MNKKVNTMVRPDSACPEAKIEIVGINGRMCSIPTGKRVDINEDYLAVMDDANSHRDEVLKDNLHIGGDDSVRTVF